MATRRPTNIKTGAKQTVELLGLKELEAKLGDLIDATIAPEAASIVRDAAEIMYHRAVANAKAVKVPHEVLEDIFLYGKQPSSQGIYGASSERKYVSALVGLRKRGRGFSTGQGAKGYREWYPSNQVGSEPKTQRSQSRGRNASLVRKGALSAKLSEATRLGIAGGSIKFDKKTHGQKIGENLGTMWELGTTKMQAKPWFRPAVSETQTIVLEKIAAGYSSLIDKKAKQK